jgi:hypothetical protein
MRGVESTLLCIAKVFAVCRPSRGDNGHSWVCDKGRLAEAKLPQFRFISPTVDPGHLLLLEHFPEQYGLQLPLPSASTEMNRSISHKVEAQETLHVQKMQI